MRIPNDLWQGCSDYWQNRFIHHHLLTIGYTAWSGYLNTGREIVVCDVVDRISPSIDWRVDTVIFDRAFIPQAQVAKYLEALELERETVTALLRAIAFYDPNRAIVVLVIGNGTVDINLLQHLKISPTDCYSQVQRRWAEFQPGLTPQRRHS